MVRPRADRRLAGVVLVLAAAVLALAGAAWTRENAPSFTLRLLKGTNGNDLWWQRRRRYVRRSDSDDALRPASADRPTAAPAMTASRRPR